MPTLFPDGTTPTGLGAQSCASICENDSKAMAMNACVLMLFFITYGFRFTYSLKGFSVSALAGELMWDNENASEK